MTTLTRTPFALLVAILSVTAVADAWGGDAGSGGDAGDTRSLATAVNVGPQYSGFLYGNDIDWYAASVGGSGPTCVAATFSSTTRAFFALGIETSGGTMTAPTLVLQNGEGAAGLAGQTPLTSTLRVRRDASGPQYGSYQFGLHQVGVPAGENDGGGLGDAGNTIASARAAAPGCIGGRLSTLATDTADVYSITVASGHVVTYSLATAASGIELRLLDSLGQAVGPAVQPGGVALTEPLSGTYFLSASRTTGTGSAGYVAGVITGPDPTACRPLCLDA